VLVENAVSVSRRDRLASNPNIRKRGNELLERLSPDLQRTVRGNPINCSSDEEAAQMITIRHYEEIQNVAKEENLSFFAILGLLMQAWRINTSQRE